MEPRLTRAELQSMKHEGSLRLGKRRPLSFKGRAPQGQSARERRPPLLTMRLIVWRTAGRADLRVFGLLFGLRAP